MKTLKTILSYLLILVFTPFVIWNASFGLYISLLLIPIFIYFSFKFFQERKFKFIYFGLVSGFFVYMFALPLTLHQLKEKQRQYITQINTGKHLSTIQKANVYGLNLTASFVALPLFPEVALESLLILIPDEDKKRSFESDFFLKSKKVQEAIRSGKKKGRIIWRKQDYFNSEARVALALNITNYEILNDGKMKVWTEINYPKRNEVIVGNEIVKAVVEEGLFRYLVDQGWFKAYRIYYTSKSLVTTPNKI
jgi:hypothetical protein